MPSKTRPLGPSPVLEARSSRHYGATDLTRSPHGWQYEMPPPQPHDMPYPQPHGTFAIIGGILRSLPLSVEGSPYSRPVVRRSKYFAMVSSHETGIFEGNFRDFRDYISGYSNGLVAAFGTKMEARAWLETKLPSTSVYKEILVPEAEKPRYLIVNEGEHLGIFGPGKFEDIRALVENLRNVDGC